MEEKKEYLLDGEPISWRKLIAIARDECDWKDPDNIYTTSGAAMQLRKNGHEVGQNKE